MNTRLTLSSGLTGFSGEEASVDQTLFFSQPKTETKSNQTRASAYR